MLSVVLLARHAFIISINDLFMQAPFTVERQTDDGLRHRVAKSPSEIDPAEETPGMKKFTWQEVAEHNSRESAWIIIDSKVYDITSKCARIDHGSLFRWDR